MKLFLSAIEGSEKQIIDRCIAEKVNLKYVLFSYYYLRKKPELLHKFKLIADEILVDSGAHSLQYGIKIDYVQYTKEYAQWIIENDCDQIIGYFEMDVDNIIGYDKVLELRKILEAACPSKIIPVWHRNRGVKDFVQMCKDYSGRIVAITGFKNMDVRDDQYLMFLKTAHKYGCKLHCLGMTRPGILNKVPFDYVDSSSWKQSGNFGTCCKFVNGKLIRSSHKGKYSTYFLDW